MFKGTHPPTFRLAELRRTGTAQHRARQIAYLIKWIAMATMVPSDIGEFETEGEKTFYKFLDGVAKPFGFVGLLSLLGCWVY